jgi:hypothetical protein
MKKGGNGRPNIQTRMENQMRRERRRLNYIQSKDAKVVP